MNVQSEFHDLQHFLIGRILQEEELTPFHKRLKTAMQQNLVTVHPGINHADSTNPTCNRCGNRSKKLFSVFPCARCHKLCTYCRACIRMGRVSSCTRLYKWIGPLINQVYPDEILQWQGELSPAQQNASSQVISAIETNETLLIWAVCGAGKTEILFRGIEVALQKGKRVCIATPRADVVLELLPRLQAAFPQIKVVGLYGGSEDRNTYAPLVIATTHQLYRFQEAFDTVIIDEVDAFPFTADKTLQHAVKKSQKQNSTTIFLTATPNPRLQSQAKSGRLPVVQIPARYHRHPLPVPTFKWIGNWKKALARNQIPVPLLKWIRPRLQSEKPMLIFFPHIELMEKALPLFQNLDPNIEAVHSEDPNRKDKVQKMREKKVPLLLTTTILERGVTFPNLDVAVLGAEERIFTESALVQISGRVGRSADYPSGEIAFFHYGKTNEMMKTKKHIEGMNHRAKKGGFL